MNAPLFQASARALGRPLALASSISLGVGAAAMLLSFPLGATRSVLPGFATAWLFFTGLAAGAVALSAAVRVAQGRFLEPALPILESAGAFLPIAFALLLPSFLLARFWVPEHAREGLSGVALRDIASFAVLWLCARRVLRHAGEARWSPPALRDSIIYLLTFVVTVSLWTVDLVMSLYEGEPSSIVPAQAFMAAFVSAIAWTALLSCWKLHAVKTRQDLGRMLFGFSAFWAYLVWCSFLPVWYANLPGETGEIILRTSGGWQVFSAAIVLLAFVLPFLVLFSETAKRRRLPMTIAAGGVLLGLFAERALLILRPLPQPSFGLPMIGGALAALGMAGLFVLLAGARLPARIAAVSEP
jgi:hypothetical protein